MFMTRNVRLDQSAIDKVVRDAAREVRRKAQAGFDRLAQTSEGQPVVELKREVAAILSGVGATTDDATLMRLATTLAEGGKINATDGGIRP
jgi:hypothetical protein